MLTKSRSLFRTLMSGTAALALVATATATAAVAAEQASEQSTDAESKEIVDLTMWSYDPLYDDMKVRDIIDLEAYGNGGEHVGEVHNVVFTKDGRVKGVIIEGGGFLDIGDTHFFVKWDDVTFSDDGESVSVPVDQENVNEFSLFDDSETVETGPRTWRSSELMGDFVRDSRGVPVGYVRDILIDLEGEVSSILVRPDLTYGVSRPMGTYAYPYYGYDYGWHPGDYSYVLPYDAAEIKQLERFDEERTGSGSSG